MQINLHISFDDLDKIISEIIKRNEFENGLIYLRITRGVSDRYHPFPIGVNPSVVVTTKFWKRPSEADYSNGVSVITFPEIRWAWRHIKSIALLPNVIAKQKSMEANTKEAWFVEKDGTVTEASSSNVFIVKDGVIITHPESESILGGVTRKTLLKMASENGIRVEERKFTISEAFSADEAFMSSTSMGAIAVNKIDDKPIKTGHIAQKLHKLYDEYAGI